MTEESSSRLKAKVKRGGYKRKCRLNPASGPIKSARLVLMQSSRDVECKPSSSCLCGAEGIQTGVQGQEGVLGV